MVRVERKRFWIQVLLKAKAKNSKWKGMEMARSHISLLNMLLVSTFSVNWYPVISILNTQFNCYGFVNKSTSSFTRFTPAIKSSKARSLITSNFRFLITWELPQSFRMRDNRFSLEILVKSSQVQSRNVFSWLWNIKKVSLKWIEESRLDINVNQNLKIICSGWLELFDIFFSFSFDSICVRMRWIAKCFYKYLLNVNFDIVVILFLDSWSFDLSR